MRCSATRERTSRITPAARQGILLDRSSTISVWRAGGVSPLVRFSPAVSRRSFVRRQQLGIEILLRLGRLQAAQKRIERFNRLGNSHRGVNATLVTPLAAQGVFVAGPALVASHHRRPATFTEHNFT